MQPILYAHPFASYCWKVLIALYENHTPFTYRTLGPDDPQAAVELQALWPLKKFPVLVDEGRPVIESSVIIEYLHLRFPGPVRLIPSDPQAALEVRFLDRCFDNYIMNPMSKVVTNQIRPENQRDTYGVEEARTTLQTAYEWLDALMANRTWATGNSFTMADCAAAPSLFYADWVLPIAERFAHVRAYRSRLLARPSVVRTVEEARPFRPFFPLGAPDRD
ncbi:MAG TPA: glutathione S-transferase family protein [Steroidobacteraceae bacterium]|nr:glutathione S-transferase family protein [Steroidobacteraceae bacterium]